MKIIVREDTVDILESINFDLLVNQTADNAYMHGRSEDPFYICDLGDIVKKHALWKERFPRIAPFYAVKCNNCPLVVQLLAALGVGFDCASRGEISQVLSMGVHPSRIIYANPAKPAAHIKYAEASDIPLMTFDGCEELMKIYRTFPEAHVVLRIGTDVSMARCPLGLKFGAQSDKVTVLLTKAWSLGMKVRGISFHVGSGCFDPSAYMGAISICHGVFTFASEKGHPMDLLDIGGGFPGELDDPSCMLLFDNVCQVINSSLEMYFPESRGVQIIAEPGRYFVSSAFRLACTVISVRENSIWSEDGLYEKKIMNYFLNDGVYSSFNCTIFDHYIGPHYFINNTDSDSDEEPVCDSIFWGPTCDSMDKVLEGFSCKRLQIGARIVFKDMGAYTYSAASNFNGFERPFIKWIISAQYWSRIFPILKEYVDIIEEESGDIVIVDPVIDDGEH